MQQIRWQGQLAVLAAQAPAFYFSAVMDSHIASLTDCRCANTLSHSYSLMLHTISHTVILISHTLALLVSAAVGT